MPDDSTIVKTWFDDVCRSVTNRDAVLSVLKSERRILEELERMPPSYQGKLEATRGRMNDAIGRLEACEAECADRVCEFVELMGRLPDATLARALTIRVLEGKKWSKTAEAVHYDKSSLFRLYNRSTRVLAGLAPDRYKTV